MFDVAFVKEYLKVCWQTVWLVSQARDGQLKIH